MKVCKICIILLFNLLHILNNISFIINLFYCIKILKYVTFYILKNFKENICAFTASLIPVFTVANENVCCLNPLCCWLPSSAWSEVSVSYTKVNLLEIFWPPVSFSYYFDYFNTRNYFHHKKTILNNSAEVYFSFFF